MAAASAYTDEQKLRFASLAQKEGRAAAAEKAGVTTLTISAWAKANGLKLARSNAAAPAKKKTGKRKNAKANGHAVANGSAVPVPAEAPSFDSVRAQLVDTLRSVDAMKAAFRRTFG